MVFALLLLPASRASASLAAVASVVTVLVICTGVRSNRPRAAAGWYFLAGACFVSAVGEIASALGAAADVLVVADSIATGGSLLVGCVGIAAISKARGSAGWNLGVFLDYLIIVVAGSMFGLDIVTGTNQVGADQILSLVGCIAAVGILTFVARMLSGRSSTFVTRCLSLAVISAVVSGALSIVYVRAGAPGATQILAELFVAAAALHPAMKKLTEPADKRIRRFSMTRTFLLAAALLVSSVDAAVQIYRLSGEVDIIWLLGSLGLALAIGLRVRTLLAERDSARRDAENQNMQLHALAKAAEHLLLASSPAAAVGTCVDAASKVLKTDVQLVATETAEGGPKAQLHRTARDSREGMAFVQCDDELWVAARLATSTHVYGVMIARDVWAEHDMQASREFLSQLINMTAMSIARMEAEDELRRSQKLEAVGRLAGGLAHELNTPLQYLKSNIQFLEEAFNRAFDRVVDADADADLLLMRDEVPDAVSQSLVGLSNASNMVRAMKTIGDWSGAEIAEVDVNRLVELTTALAQERLDGVGCVTTDLRASRTVVCNSVEATEALLAVIQNAVEELIDAFGIGNREALLTLQTFDDGADVCIAVMDNGRGIPLEIQERIWEQFFTTKDVGRGVGLGLSVARAQVERAHGTIDVSTDKTGTTFILRFPAAAAAPTGSRP